MSHKVHNPVWDEELIKKHDLAGPRYTSYPTALQFTEQFGEADYIHAAEGSNVSLHPLSLYFHIPFCDTICYYCACNKVVTKNKGKARPYLDRLLQEIEMQTALFDKERPVTQLHWGGGTPTFLSESEMTELMYYTTKHFNLLRDKSAEFSIEIDPRDVNGDTVALLSGLGFNRASLGIQDFDPQVQQAVNRIQSYEMVSEVLKDLRNYGFGSINFDLIYGLPYQSLDSFVETLKKVIDLAPDRLSLFNYAHLPERFKPQRRINVVDLPANQIKLQILHTSIDMLNEAGYVYIGMDHFAKPDDELAIAQKEGELQRNFQGYSTQLGNDLIGMGLSSISSVNHTFSQNETDMEAYCNAIDSGHLPVKKGYKLVADDLIRREVINQIICHFRLDTRYIENRFKINFAEYFADELIELSKLADDRLVEMSGPVIEVTDAGRLLVRRVCMVFDFYLRQASQEKRYSKII